MKPCWNRMKLDDINAFVAVVNARSVSQAARDLMLTQPAITRRVQNLEEALGAPLLDRDTKPLRPNAFGVQVYERCRAVLHEVARLGQMADADRAPSGPLRLGLTQGIADVVLRDTIEELGRTWPQVATSVATGWGGALVERVNQGELDAAAVWLGSRTPLPRNTEGELMTRSPLVVVARRTDIVKRSYRLADWSDRGWVLNPDGCGFRAGLKRALNDRGLPFVLKMDISAREMQLEMVARGHGLGLIPAPLLAASAHHATLGIVPLADFKPEVDLWLVQGRTPGTLRAPIEAFAAQLRRSIGGQHGKAALPTARSRKAHATRA
jgi:DNA-binding transcriptional LysR family regulator